MALKVDRIDTWAAALEDKPGSLAARLRELAQARVDLEFIVARRAPEKPGTGVVFVTPIQGATQQRAAKAAGFQKTQRLHTVRVQGSDKPGCGAVMMQALADAGLNLRGVSGAVIGSKLVGYFALDTPADAAKAARVLRKL